MYAIIQQGGHQYKVKPGDDLELYHLTEKEDEKVILKEVLLLVEDTKVLVGQPFIPNASVTLKILKHLKGEKIRVARFKAKSRYTKIKGFRPFLTKVHVESIKADSQNNR